VTERGIRCHLCPHRCVLGPGEVGACKVRRGTDEGIETATFASTVQHADPVERKPLFHYRPGTPTITLAAPGCSFRCDYCVNFRISQYGKDNESTWQAHDVDPSEVVGLAAAMNGCVALSYTEPSLAPELTLELARRGRDMGVDVVWKSNGFLTPEAIALCAPVLAAVNIDLKCVDEKSHRRLTGGSVRPVIDAITAFREHGTWVEVSTPISPGITEPAGVAEVLASIGADIPWHVVRFTPAFRMRDRNPTHPDAIEAAVMAGKAAGLRYVYVERALGDDGRTTLCPSCETAVVRRGVWSLVENRLQAGRCPECGTGVEGRW
jgi:pyruvate formate lyase activating enzyme